MKISKSLLHKAAAAGIINPKQVDTLWSFMIKDESTQTPFNIVNLLFYLGGLIAICSIIFLVSPYIINLGRWGLVSVLFIYGLAAFLLSQYFLKNKFTIPAALCLIFIICLTPVFLSSLQFAIWMTQNPNSLILLDLFASFEKHYFLIELGTWLVAGLFFYIYRFSILVLPLCLMTWYLSYDLYNHILGNKFFFSGFFKSSLLFGFICTTLAIFLDIKHKKHHENSFWLYIVGLSAFWSGYINEILSNNEWSWLTFGGMNLVLLGLGTILVRKVFLVYGAIGILMYLGHIIYKLFDSLHINWLAGSFILTLFGLLIIKLGMLIHQYQNNIQKFIYQFLPSSFKTFLNEIDE